MKKQILIFLLVVAGLSLSAQQVTGPLSGATARKLKDRLLVCGIDQARSPYVFKAILYDKDLKVVNEFSKSLRPGSKGDNFTLVVLGNKIQIKFMCKGSCDDEFINLTMDLREIESGTIPAQKMQVYFYSVPVNERPSPFFGYVDPGQKFLGSDLIAVFYNKANYYSQGTFGFVPYAGKPSIKRVLIKDSLGLTEFEVKWETELGLFFAKSHNVFQLDPSRTMFVVYGNEQDQPEHTFLYIVDTQSGKIIKKTIVQTGSNKAELNNPMGYYDAEKKLVIIAGEINQVDRKMGFLFYDDAGNFISSSTAEIPSFAGVQMAKTYLPSRDQNIAKAIGRNSMGNYFVQTETTIKKEATSAERNERPGDNSYSNMFRDVPVAYSYYELNSKNELRNSKTTMLDRYMDYSTAKFYSASPDGKTMLISNLLNKKRTTEVVNLYPGGSAPLKLFEFDYNPKKLFQEDYVHQFMMSDNTIIVLHRTGDAYELKALKYQ